MSVTVLIIVRERCLCWFGTRVVFNNISSRSSKHCITWNRTDRRLFGSGGVSLTDWLIDWYISCLVARPYLWKIMLLKYSIIMTFVCRLLSWCKISRSFCEGTYLPKQVEVRFLILRWNFPLVENYSLVCILWCSCPLSLLGALPSSAAHTFIPCFWMWSRIILCTTGRWFLRPWWQCRLLSILCWIIFFVFTFVNLMSYRSLISDQTS